MAKQKKGKSLHNWISHQPEARAGKLRIVGGDLKGRQFNYSGDIRTRPMKDNTREALFNLIGGWIKGKTVFDLFSGTGAVALESISRGANRAIVVERHFPTAKLISQNAKELKVEDKVEIESADVFFWFRQFMRNKELWPENPWAVFICPPYALFESERQKMGELIQFMKENVPPDSLVVVEFDNKYKIEELPDPHAWRIREYSPAFIAIYRNVEKAETDNSV